MDWRKHRYLNPKPHPKSGEGPRRLITPSEEIQQLKNSIQSLKASVASVDGGDESYLGHIATEIRALTYWNDKVYNPLLLRVAGRFSLPLPIYAGFITLPEDNLTGLIHLGDPSFFKILPAHRLVDFQEWLSYTCFKLRDSTIKAEHQDVTIKKLVLIIASSQGSAHYDDDVDIRLDWLTATTAFQISLQKPLLLGIASVIVEVGQYVLNKAVSR